MTVYTGTDLRAKIVGGGAHSWSDVIHQKTKWPNPRK